MLTVCSWCNKVLIEGDKEQGTSHGCCLDCIKKMESEDIYVHRNQE